MNYHTYPAQILPSYSISPKQTVIPYTNGKQPDGGGGGGWGGGGGGGLTLYMSLAEMAANESRGVRSSRGRPDAETVARVTLRVHSRCPEGLPHGTHEFLSC